MPSTEFASIREAARRILGTTSEVAWPDDELDAYADEAQVEWARRTQCLRGRTVITTPVDNLRVYDLPEDFLAGVRAELSDGTELRPTNSRELKLSSATFTTDSGDPQAWYSDLDGFGKFRLYPNPTTSVAVQPVVFTTNRVSSVNMEVGAAFCQWQGEVFTVTNTHVLVYDTRGVLTYSAAHGASPNGFPGKVVARGRNVWFNDGSDTIFRFNLDANELTTTDTNATVMSMAATGDQTLSAVIVDTALPHTKRWMTWELSSVNLSSFSFDPTQMVPGIYLPVGPGGAYVVCTLMSDPIGGRVYWKSANDAGTLASIAGCSGLAAESSCDTVSGTYSTTIYATGTAGLYSVSPAGAATLVDASVQAYYLAMASGTVYYFIDGSWPLVSRSADGTITEYAIPLSGAQSPYPALFGAATVDGGYLLVVLDNSDPLYATEAVAYSTGCENGEVVYADGAPANQDEGIVVDIVDDSDEVVFDHDFGVCSQIISDNTSVRLWYTRLPTPGVMEIKGEETALAQYVAARALGREGDMQQLQKAAAIMSFYDRAVARSMRRQVQGWTGGQTARPVAHHF